MVYACNGFLQYYGISTCNFQDYVFATFVIFILQQTLEPCPLKPALFELLFLPTEFNKSLMME